MNPSEYNQFTVKRSGFIGYRMDNCVVPWCGTDNEEIWLKHIRKEPDNPNLRHYDNVVVEYHRNKHGHRSAEIEDVVNHSAFNLVVGDSFSEGQGLAESELYYRHIDKALNTRTYNMALGGTGVDTFQYNLAIWRQRVRKEPARIIVQWTQIFRTMFSDYFSPNFIINGTLPFHGDDNAARFIDSGLNLNVFLTRAKCFDAFVQTLFPKSQIINLHMSFWEEDAVHYGQNNRVVWLGPDDYARDLQHWGPKSHRTVAERILKAVK